MGFLEKLRLHWGIFSPTIPYSHSRGVNVMGEISHSPLPGEGGSSGASVVGEPKEPY